MVCLPRKKNQMPVVVTNPSVENNPTGVIQDSKNGSTQSQSKTIERKGQLTSSQKDQKENPIQKDRKLSASDEDQELSASDEDQILSPIQLIAFHLPDMVTLTNNLFFTLLITAMPERRLLAGETDPGYTALMVNQINVFSLIASVGLSLTSGCVPTVFWLMFTGNICFYIGATLIYTSTTAYLSFPGSFEVGTVLAGFGDAAIINLCITYKFELYRRWELEMRSVGARASIVYSLAMNVSGILGGVVSGVTVPARAEQATLTATGLALVLMTLCIVIPRFVK